MPSEASEVGSIVGFLVLNRADWLAGVAATERDADKLSRLDPKIHIETNAPKVLSELAAVAAATKALQDAQGRQAVAALRLNELRAKGVTGSRLAAAEESNARALRAVELATIRVGAANDKASLAAAAAAAKLENLSKSSDKFGRSAGTARREVSGLVTALAVLGPAALPIAAVLTGALAGAVPTVVTLALGFKGLQNAFKQGTLQTTEFGQQLGVAKQNLTQVEKIAAGGMLGGLTAGLHDINAQMPTVNREVAAFSTQTGNIVSHVAPGLVSLFTQMSPLFQTIGDDLERGSVGFQHWAQSSTGVARFVAYVQTSLPEVEHTLGELGELVSHTVQAFEPWGSTMLTSVRLFSTALNSIPLPVLQALVPLMMGAFVGNRLSNAIGNTAGNLGALAGRMSTAGIVASSTAPAVGMVGRAVGFLGPAGLAAGVAIGGLSLIMGSHKRAAVEDAEAVNRLTEALKAGTGALQVMQELTKGGAIGAANALGVNPQAVLQAVVQQGTAAATLRAQIAGLQAQQTAAADRAAGAANAYGKLSQGYALTADEVAKYGGTLQSTRQAQLDAEGSSDRLSGRLHDLNGSVSEVTRQYEQAKQKAAEFARDQGSAQLAADLLSGKLDEQARALGMTTGQYFAASFAADQNTQSTQAQIRAYQAENDAASILMGTLDQLNGKKLSAADALNAFQSSLVNFTNGAVPGADGGQATQKQAIATDALAIAQRKYNAALKDGDPNKIAAAHLALERAQLALAKANDALAKSGGTAAGTIKGMDAASVQLRGELNNQVHLLESLVAADGGWQNSTAKSRAEMETLRKQVINNAVAHGVDRKEVTAYIDELFKIPTNIPPTSLDADTTRAKAKIEELGELLKALGQQWKAGINVTANVSGGRAKLFAAGGGTVHGPGGPKSDSVHAMLSPGEEVIQEPYASMYRPLLKAINAGKMHATGASRSISNNSVVKSTRVTGGLHLHSHYPIPAREGDSFPLMMQMAAETVLDGFE